jgi:hypothetical protein
MLREILVTTLFPKLFDLVAVVLVRDKWCMGTARKRGEIKAHDSSGFGDW